MVPNVLDACDLVGCPIPAEAGTANGQLRFCTAENIECFLNIGWNGAVDRYRLAGLGVRKANSAGMQRLSLQDYSIIIRLWR